MAEGDVAGILQSFRRVFLPVAALFPAVQNLFTACKLLRTAAVEGVFQRYRALLQRRRQGDGLKGGARLVAVGDAPVAPLVQPRRHHGGIVGGHGVLFFLRIRQCFGVGFHFRQFFHRLFIIDLQIIIGIIAALGGHAQNGAGVDIHHNGKGAVLHIVFLNGRLQILFQIILHRGIQRQHQTVAVGGLVILFIGVEHFRLIVALGGDHRARRALQHIVVVGLQPLGAAVGIVGKADELRRQRAVGIIALRRRLQMDSRQIVFVDELPHLVGSLPGLLVGYNLVAPGGIRRLFQNLALVHIQNFGKAVGNEVYVLLRLTDLQRVEENILHRGGGGQRIHIPVIDDAAAGRDRCGTGLVLNGVCLVFVVVENHQSEQGCHKGDKKQNSAHDHHCQCAAQYLPVGLFPVVGRLLFSVSARGAIGLCHGMSFPKAAA